MFYFRDVCVADQMDVPRRQRTIRERRNPLLYFNEQDFKRRYRLTKATVSDLAMQYSASGYCSTMCSGVGGGVTAGERVGIKKLHFLIFLLVFSNEVQKC